MGDVKHCINKHVSQMGTLCVDVLGADFKMQGAELYFRRYFYEKMCDRVKASEVTLLIFLVTFFA